MSRFAKGALIGAAVVLVAASSSWALMLEHMQLGKMCDNAQRIFSGTVIEISSSKVEAGGGMLPTVTYRILVDDTFKGDIPEVDGKRIAEVRMLGKAEPRQAGPYQSLDALKELPVLEMGRAYLLFTTQPSAIGLSTTVGLGQGCFHVLGRGDKTEVVNAYDNVGLLAADEKRAGEPARGPLPYDLLAERIRAHVGAEEEGR